MAPKVHLNEKETAADARRSPVRVLKALAAAAVSSIADAARSLTAASADAAAVDTAAMFGAAAAAAVPPHMAASDGPIEGTFRELKKQLQLKHLPAGFNMSLPLLK
jgi:hypothetical protein